MKLSLLPTKLRAGFGSSHSLEHPLGGLCMYVDCKTTSCFMYACYVFVFARDQVMHLCLLEAKPCTWGCRPGKSLVMLQALLFYVCLMVFKY